MKYLPIFFDIRWRRCLVVGGGQVAVQKVNALLNAGARVTLVSAAIDPLITAWIPNRMVDAVEREYRTEDLEGHCLVIAATNDRQTQQKVAKDARARGVPCNVVDRPELCTFIMPAVFTADDLTVAVSTNGSCPGFARLMRDRLGELLGPEYPFALRIFKALRQRWQNEGVSLSERQRRFDRLFYGPLLPALRARNWPEVDRALLEVAGAEVTLAALGLGGDGEMPRQFSSKEAQASLPEQQSPGSSG
jgi:precorrin-2 dehydrogenase/sirohydrochlorin ferrochelatase